MSTGKRLLIVYHTKTGNTGRMAAATLRGARHPDVNTVHTRYLQARHSGPEDLLWADGLLLGTPENFGQMSGMMKDFLDRTFYEVEGLLKPLSTAIFISAGNDGTGALRALRRIIGGYPLVEVQPAVIARDGVDEDDLKACETLGMTLAAGLEAGIY